MADEIEEIKFEALSNFFPKQNKALEMSKVFDFLLYGGTLGAGKSRFLRWAALWWLMNFFKTTGIRGIRGAVFCEDYPALNDRHIAYIKEEFPTWIGKFNEQRHEFKIDDDYGGGVLAFRNLDDPEKYLSVEFAVAAMDEINRNTYETFDKVRRRLRWPGIDRPKFLGACNPVGEPWVRDIWIDRIFPDNLKLLKDQFYFVEAFPKDNPYLGEKYYEDLKTQDPTFVKAAVEGDWHAYDTYMDKDGYMAIIPSNVVREAQTATHDDHVGVRVICIDPAAGGDESAVLLCSETVKEVLFSKKLNDTMVLAGMTIKLAVDNEADIIAIDKTGLGKPIFDRIRELLKAKKLEIDIVGIDFGEKSDDEMQFADNKTELFCQDVLWIVHGGLLVKHPRWNEWNNIKYKINSDGIKELEPKVRLRKRGAPSPDVLDAGVLFQSIDLNVTKKRIRTKKFGKEKFHDNIEDIWRS